MTNAAHRDTDSRTCGATTVSNQNRNVFVNGLLWSIEGDPNSHGDGSLLEGTKEVYIGSIPVINVGDSAQPDGLCSVSGGEHCSPNASSGSPNVFVGD